MVTRWLRPPWLSAMLFCVLAAGGCRELARPGEASDALAVPVREYSGSRTRARAKPYQRASRAPRSWRSDRGHPASPTGLG